MAGTPCAAVLWDVDGTLVDSEPLHERSIARTLAEEGITPPPDLHAMLLGHDAAEIHRLLARRLGLRRSFDDWARSRWSHYLSRVSGLQARPGALEAFEAVRARGWRQAVVSNSPRRVVQANLRAVGLDRWVDAIVSVDDVARPKPDPAPYLRALHDLGVAAPACVAVEDSEAGARSALGAGCLTVFWPQSRRAAPSGALAVDARPGALRAALERLAVDPAAAPLRQAGARQPV